ncbi:hypothetical protein M407DRAFT_28728 [Tulasnella calospora MUT 4182]|uniref:Uncharacterized protein n=1 Tax=Tulasnella calospora MUT 4182 TaxID=1051891 RepID=A0A0C3LK40_9AGAM|nr:hypothetical protein M407DRAFT_28728 [Tulasnella calospora MUT 4182]
MVNRTGSPSSLKTCKESTTTWRMVESRGKRTTTLLRPTNHEDNSPAPSGGVQNAELEVKSEDESQTQDSPEPPEEVSQALEIVYPSEELITGEQAVEWAYKVAADSTEPRSF